MLTRAVFVKLVKAVVMLMMVWGDFADTAPTEKGLVRPANPRSSEGPLKSDDFLRAWFETRTTDGTAARTSSPGHRPRSDHRPVHRPDHRPDRRPGHRPNGPNRKEQILEMISALEEAHRTINSTLSSRITFITRASGRHAGKKNRQLAVSDKAVSVPKATTAPPAVSNSTVTRPDTAVPGRNLRKSLPPQHKKPNKRVCFWKYCSQN